MDAVLPFIPWALFGIMVLFGGVFAVVALRASNRASAAEERAAQVAAQLRQVMQRAQGAESLISQAEQRAFAAEARVAQAEAAAAQARDMVKAADARAAGAEERA